MASEAEPSAGNAGALPGYSFHDQASPTRERQEHVYSLENGKGKAWLFLKVKSRSTAAKSLPLYFNDDTIAGSVETNLEKPESVKAVTISIRGEVTSVGQDGVLFLDISSTLWTPKDGEKLAGQLKWPFELIIPKESTIPLTDTSKDKPRLFPLPPSYSQKSSPGYIDYKLTVTVKRGTFKVNQVLGTNFTYYPLSKALPPLGRRLTAYSVGKNPPGPDADEEGWKVYPPLVIKGKIFESKSVDLHCTFAVALPLSYATGSPIPVYFTMQCEDEQALDLLAKPSAINVYLTRAISIGSDASDDAGQRRSDNTFQENVGRAYFWSVEEGIVEKGVRRLQGEIDVSKGLRPSFNFVKFSVRYFLNVHPLRSTGFVPAQTDNLPLISEKVSIATANARGVTPRSMAPPGYVREEPADYNNAVGYLENGNQRFLHHHGQ